MMTLCVCQIIFGIEVSQIKWKVHYENISSNKMANSFFKTKIIKKTLIAGCRLLQSSLSW